MNGSNSAGRVGNTFETALVTLQWRAVFIVVNAKQVLWRQYDCSRGNGPGRSSGVSRLRASQCSWPLLGRSVGFTLGANHTMPRDLSECPRDMMTQLLLKVREYMDRMWHLLTSYHQLVGFPFTGECGGI